MFNWSSVKNCVTRHHIPSVLVPTHVVIRLTGEIFELKAELNNEKKEKRKEAVKKVIAAMTVGKDVRCLNFH